MEEKTNQLQDDPEPSNRFAFMKGFNNVTLHYFTRYREISSRSQGLFLRGNC